MSTDLMQATNALFDATFKALERPTRQDRLDGICADISRFNPNLEQGWELIDAVLRSWAEEFPAHRLTVIEEEAKSLKIAVSEAQPHEQEE